MQRIRFWGTRGSLPVALTAVAVRRKLIAALRDGSGRTFASDDEIERYIDTLPFDVAGTFGGNTSCVELETGESEYVVCDLGSGLRPFGQAALARHGPATPQTYHLFVSHLHWDHIMGLPFFGPAYIPGNRLFFYGAHQDLEAALRRQMEPPSFPVNFSVFNADIEFVHLAPDRTHDVAGMQVTLKRQHHTGDSYGYRFERNGRAVVYSTDSEHKFEDPGESAAFARFFRNADVVIFDAMYSLAEAISVKADWGHSSNIVGVELCQLAQVRHLCLFHHEPALADTALLTMLGETQRYEEITRTGDPMRVSAAYDGLELTL
jgi:phosphoribosyl 1,2-cyclic phosphodiesterase